MNRRIFNQPVVSIVVPVYNTAKYLEQCLESILKQDYKNIEVIIINDGSEDNSGEICEKYERIERVKYIKIENSGVSVARNVGINLAQGEYICFIDSDDYIKSNHISSMVNLFNQSEEIDLVYVGYQLDYDNLIIEKEARIKNGKYNFSILKDNIIDDGTLSGILLGSICTALYKKDIIEKYNLRLNEHLKVNEDGIFNIEYLQKSNCIYIDMDIKSYFYRQNTKPIKDINKKIEELQKATEALNTFSSFSDIQRNRRQFSEAVWIILDYCKSINGETIFEKIKFIRHICDYYEIEDNYNYLNLKKLNNYKYVYAKLLYKKHYLILLILTKNIIPLLSKYLKR